MLIKSRKKSDCHESEVTPESLYCNRREFITAGVSAVIGTSVLTSALAPVEVYAGLGGKKLANVNKTPYDPGEKLSSYKDITSYNNFYEFGTDKTDPAKNAQNFVTQPWTISVEGHANKTGEYDIDDLFKRFPLEERIYRFRCVEAWSMVVPWVGFSLASLLKFFEPNSKAKFVEFQTLYDPQRMPGQNRRVLDWPYVEGLRIDEAMHPLSMMVVGLYGEELPNQNGAPLRLMLPWKYGFKNIKSIVKIRFTESQPQNTWMLTNSNEYGFYANVNPQVDHPRWSQKRERRLGEFFKRETLMFNGYAEEVASLYKGMDLSKHF